MKKLLLVLVFATLFTCEVEEIKPDLETSELITEIKVFEDENISWGDSINNVMRQGANRQQRITIKGRARVNSDILLPSNTFFDIRGTILFAEDGINLAVIRNADETNENITVLGGEIYGDNVPDKNYVGILFTNVTNGVIKGTKCFNVHTTESADTGNFRLQDCFFSTVKGVEANGTWKAGVFVEGGSHNTVSDCNLNGTNDSGIISNGSDFATILANDINDCGQSNGSNISGSFTNALIAYNISRNASGVTNGNGLNVGAGSTNTNVIYNIFYNNNAKGVFIQGPNTRYIAVDSNIFIKNALETDYLSSAGLAIYYEVSEIFARRNHFINNKRGIELRNTSFDNSITLNKFGYNVLETILDGGTNTFIRGNWNVEDYPEFTDLTYLNDLDWLTFRQKEFMQSIDIL